MSATINPAIYPSKPSSEDALHKYERIVEEAIPSLLRIARRLTWPDHDLGADIVQDAVLKGLRAIKSNKLEVSCKTTSWLKQAVYLEFLMQKRDAKRLSFLGSESLDSNAAITPQPFANDLSLELRNALDELPDEQRILVILVDLEELEYQEVSDVLQIPIGTVRSRLSRARWKLANRLHHLSGESK